MSEVDGCVAFFLGVYGGGRGLAAGMSWEKYNKDIAPDLSKDMIESPVSTSRNPTDPAELARLEPLEAAALKQLEAMCTDMTRPLGAIVIEPILGSKGVHFYRDEFLLQVRALADKHGVPFVLDEVLTCGGRAGSFFYFEQVPGLQPDYVTFGKALQAAGIAQVRRTGPTMPKRSQSEQRNVGMTTLDGDSVRMLKATQVMKALAADDLMKNARDVGAYLVEELRALQTKFGLPVDASGSGMLIGVCPELRTPLDRIGVPTTQEEDGRCRLMPPGTLTKDDVDHLVTLLSAEIEKQIASGQLKRRVA
jgi:L-lysine 6-transaminase